MSPEVMRFDAANYLDDIADAAAYLQIALEESVDDPTAVTRALGVIARSGNVSDARPNGDPACQPSVPMSSTTAGPLGSSVVTGMQRQHP